MPQKDKVPLLLIQILKVCTVEPACMVHGCKVNPLLWSIFG